MPCYLPYLSVSTFHKGYLSVSTVHEGYLNLSTFHALAGCVTLYHICALIRIWQIITLTHIRKSQSGPRAHACPNLAHIRIWPSHVRACPNLAQIASRPSRGRMSQSGPISDAPRARAHLSQSGAPLTRTHVPIWPESAHSFKWGWIYHRKIYIGGARPIVQGLEGVKIFVSPFSC